MSGSASLILGAIPDDGRAGACSGWAFNRSSVHYDQVNYLHPFREGNGRTQRFFFDRLAVAAGWWLDWTQITGAVNDAASRAAAEDHDLAALQEMFAVILTPAPHRRRPRS